MNIIHLRASNFYGGPERQLHNHALLSRGQHYRLSICSFSEEGEDPEFIRIIAQDGVDTTVFNVRNAYDRSAISTLRNFIIDRRVAILCTHEYRTHIIGYLATRRTPARWVAFSRGWTQESLKIRLYNLLDKFIVRFADRIVAVSHAQAEKLRRLHVPDGKIAVVSNAVSSNLQGEVEDLHLKDAFGFAPDDVVCVTAGRFSKEKGQLDLMKSIAMVAEQDPRAKFVLFGDGPDLPRVRTLVESGNLTDAVVLPGHRANALGYMKGADILVNPSLSEGLPNVVLEGMAMQLAVVATRVGGVPEIIESDVSGILVEPGDAPAMSEAILKLIGDQETRQRLGRAAFETVRQRYTFESQTEQLARLYSELVK